MSYLGHDSGDCNRYHALVRDFGTPNYLARPQIVCLCGSTKFGNFFPIVCTSRKGVRGCVC